MDAFSGGVAEHVIASRRRDELPRLVAGFGRLLAGAGPEPAEWSRCLPNRRAQAGRVAGVRGGNEPGGPGDAGGALPRCVLRSEVGMRAKRGNRCARTWRSPWIFGPDAGEQRHNVKVQRIGGHRLIGGGGGARVGLGTRSNHWVAVAGSASSSVRVLWGKKSCNVCLKA